MAWKFLYGFLYGEVMKCTQIGFYSLVWDFAPLPKKGL